MSLTAPKDTLAYQRKGRPLALHRDLSQLSVVATCAPMHQFEGSHGSAKPETEALWFYLTNHAVHEIEQRFDPDEPLPPQVLAFLEDYNKRNSIIAARAFYYLLLITCRESRHCNVKSSLKPQIEASWGHQAWDGLNHYPDHASVTAVTNVFKTYTTHCTLAQVTEAVRYSFYAKGAYSGGFGGPKWGKISDCLISYLTGETSAEMMLDTVWTLCHNGGPIFNKGMLYSHNGSSLNEILDVQRSGQIPQLVQTAQPGIASKSLVTAQMRDYASKVAALFPDSEAFKPEGQAHVDWHAVEALGGLGTYGKYKPGGAGPGTIPVGPGGKIKPPKLPGHGGEHISHGPGHLGADASLTVGADAKLFFSLAGHAGLAFKKKTRKEIMA
jgi:hypothetical protein